MKLGLFILFSSILFYLSPASALSKLNFPEIPSKNKPLSINLQTEFYRSVSNFADFGQYVELPGENYFQYVGFYPRIKYSPSSRYFSFQLFAESFYAESKSLELKRNVLRTSLVGGGLSLHYKFKTLYSGMELKGGIPLQSNFQTPDEMIIGDGAYFLEPGLWFLFQPSQLFYIYYNLAFRYRMFSLSSLLFNRLGGVLQTKYLEFGASTDSFLSLIPDEFSSQPEKRWSYTKKVNGGSYRFFSVNPSVLSFTIWGGVKLPPSFIKIYFNIDTLGKNYARGLSFGLITTLKWNTKSSVIDRRKNNMSFDFDEEMENQRSRQKKSYFEEEEDPYSKENFNKELKEELKSLRY